MGGKYFRAVQVILEPGHQQGPLNRHGEALDQEGPHRWFQSKCCKKVND